MPYRLDGSGGRKPRLREVVLVSKNSSGKVQARPAIIVDLRSGRRGLPAHDLLPESVQKRMPMLYALEGVPATEKEIIVKWFFPAGCATWYVIEGAHVYETPDGETVEVSMQKPGPPGATRVDSLLFGFAELFHGCGELGYISLKELQSVERASLRVERDLHFGKHFLQEILDGGRP